MRGLQEERKVLAALAIALAAAIPAAASAQALEKRVVSFAAAQRMAEAARQAARARGVEVVVVVVDDGGHIVLLEKMDGAQVASVNVGIGKARTAAIYRRPSKDFEDQIKNGRVAALALADATPLQGGVPVLLDGKVIGAIGVSGDSPQIDEDIAKEGARAFR
jgi:glc operon protein GlcG